MCHGAFAGRSFVWSPASWAYGAGAAGEERDGPAGGSPAVSDCRRRSIEVDVPELGGDRPHESLIFQCFADIDLAATPILAAFAGFRPGDDPLNEFIFDSFFFRRNVV